MDGWMDGWIERIERIEHAILIRREILFIRIDNRASFTSNCR
jgi:hypothetical protein